VPALLVGVELVPEGAQDVQWGGRRLLTVLVHVHPAGLHSLPGGVRLVFHVRPELDLWVALTPRGVSDCLHGLAT
jgi:hypothetical protein